MAKSDIKEGEDFYFSELGYKVFTEKFLLKRGYAAEAGAGTAPTDTTKKQILL